MPQWMLAAYLKQIPALRASRQLAAIEAAAVPHMESGKVRETVEKYQRELGDDFKPLRGKEAEAALARIGFNVHHVPKKDARKRKAR